MSCNSSCLRLHRHSRLGRCVATTYRDALVVGEMQSEHVEQRGLFRLNVAFEDCEQHSRMRLPLIGLRLATTCHPFHQVIDHHVLDGTLVDVVAGVDRRCSPLQRFLDLALLGAGIGRQLGPQPLEQRTPLVRALRFEDVAGEPDRLVVIVPKQRAYVSGVHRRRLQQQSDLAAKRRAQQSQWCF